MRTTIIALALLCGSASAALAQTWSHTVTFKRGPGGTSIKITEPDGFTVSIVAGGETKSDTIPAIFTVANQAAYIPITVKAKDGQSWTQKIEVRVHQQTELAVKYTPAAGAAPAVAGRKHIGKVTNWTHKCGRADHGTTRYDFMHNGAQAYTFTVAPGRALTNQEVAAGSYDVRVFLQQGGQFRFIKTTEGFGVTRDGWEFYYGCR